METLGWEAEFTKLFRRCYKAYREKSGRKSALRSFAASVKLAPGSTSQIISGKRTWKLTPERAREIAKKLELNAKERSRLLSLMRQGDAWEKHLLREEDFPLLTNWIYPAVLFSFDLPKEKRSSESIAERLGVKKEQVEAAIGDLLARGFLKRDGSGEIQRDPAFYASSDGIPSQTIRESHRLNLEVAGKALAALPPSRRDFTSLTFVGSPEKAALLKAEIRKLYDLALGLMDTDDPNGSEVFRLSVNLFPMNFSPSEPE